jgi:hypothetical protein
VNTTTVSTLRAASASGLFALTLLAFCVLTVIATFGIQGPLSGFFFDLLGHTFPIACPNTLQYEYCSAIAQGWNAYWSFIVWGLAALAYGIVARNRPLGQRIFIALVLIPTIILLMQLGMSVVGYREWADII